MLPSVPSSMLFPPYLSSTQQQQQQQLSTSLLNSSSPGEKAKRHYNSEVDPARYRKVLEDGVTKFACSLCGNTYKWRKSLNKHWKEKHITETPPPLDAPVTVKLRNGNTTTTTGNGRISPLQTITATPPAPIQPLQPTPKPLDLLLKQQQQPQQDPTQLANYLTVLHQYIQQSNLNQAVVAPPPPPPHQPQPLNLKSAKKLIAGGGGGSCHSSSTSSSPFSSLMTTPPKMIHPQSSSSSASSSSSSSSSHMELGEIPLDLSMKNTTATTSKSIGKIGKNFFKFNLCLNLSNKCLKN